MLVGAKGGGVTPSGLRRELLLVYLGVVAGCASTPDKAEQCLGQGAFELRVCAAGATVEGIDVSYYQGTVDWAAVKRAGKVFAFARVSDGTAHPDSQFARNWPAMKTAGIIRGVYQFFRASVDPTAQANLLLSKLQAAGGLQPGDLPPVIDIETADGQSNATVVARMRTWLTRLEQAVGRKPLIYTAAMMSSVLGNNFSSYPLWVANYTTQCPLMPSDWTSWKFWQKSSTGSVGGISGNVDLDVFNGTLSDLRAFAIEPPDGGTAPDAGVRDGGAPRDGGTTPSDGGLPRDGGVAPDAGVRDGGNPPADDGGLEEDGGGEPEDGGVDADGGGSSSGEGFRDDGGVDPCLTL
jgi:lysozyme